MIALLIAEFRKLLTLRSTYFATLFGLLFIAFMTFYVSGIRTSESIWANPDYLAGLIIQAPTVIAPLGLVVGALLVTHEYRYNIIMHTLTASTSRTKVLLAKLIVIKTYAVLIVLLGVGLSVACFYAGAALANKTVPPQQVETIYLLARGLFYGVGLIVFGFFIATILRNIAATLVIMFMAPATIEPLLSLLLKENAVYLPFAALRAQVLPPNTTEIFGGGVSLAPGKAATVFLIYLVISALVTWWLFLRRDAS